MGGPEKLEKAWTVLQWFLILFILMLTLWLEIGIVGVLGGGLVLFPLASFFGFSRRSSPDWTMVYLGLALLAVSMVSQNLSAGLLSDERVSNFDFVFLMDVSFVASVIGLSLVVGGLLPKSSKPADYPSWARRLWTGATYINGVSLILVTAISGVILGAWPDRLRDLSILATSVTLIVSGALGLLSISMLPQIEMKSRAPLRRLVPTTALLLLGGFIVELLRGDWTLWLLTASVFASVFMWLSRVTGAQKFKPDSPS